MKKKQFFLGVAVGSIIGGVTALFTAPKKGSEMREDVKNETEKVYKEVKEQYEVLSDKASEKYKKETENLKKLYKENTEKYKAEISKLNEKYFSKKEVEEIPEEDK